MPSMLYKRQPAVPCSIININPESHIRVRILGHVIDKSNSILVVDDGSSKAEILSDQLDSVDIGDLVRIFCRVLPLEQGYELRGEIIQKANNIDLELYRKISG